MIGVGINENVILSKAEITEKEKGTLALTWRSAGTGEAKETNGFEALAGDGYADTGNGESLTLRLFSPLKPFSETSEGKLIPLGDQVKSAQDSIGEKKNILFQILTTYMTSDKAKFDPYRGTGLTGENFADRIIQEGTLQHIMRNLSEDFVRLITPFLDKEEHPVRLLLVKQSATKAFADFRQRFVKDNPFIENALVPIEATKLKFTKHEITKGLHDATPTAQTAADTLADKAEEKTAENVFGLQPA